MPIKVPVYPASGAYKLDTSFSDTEDLPISTRAILVGTAGDLKVDMINGDTVTLPVYAGIVDVAIKRVYVTGTTASNVIGLYN